MEHLGVASTLSSQRAQLPNPQYVQQARQLREWAQTVINQTKVERYPDDLRKFLKDSSYSSALPEHIAKVIRNGFPGDKTIAISSSELGLYVQLANTLISGLGALITATNKLNVKGVIIPENEIGFDVIIPRDVFKNSVDDFIDLLSRFTRIMSYLIELTTGEANSPSLSNASTSDPVVGCGLVGAAAWAFLNFYKLVLEVVDKQISLLKTLKELRAFSPSSGSEELEERIKSIVR
jgi:hypothetical protein